MTSMQTFSAAGVPDNGTSDAQAVPVDDRALRRIVFASVAGNALEWYDFFLYSTAAALVFGQLFFPKGTDPLLGTLAAFAGFAVGFAARPFGGVLFGHIGEGNLHFNVLRCSAEQEHDLYAPMMELIAGCGGNVSSEHGVGSRKRKYVGMSREPADIAAMRTLKTAFDPTGYLNAAVLFD